MTPALAVPFRYTLGAGLLALVGLLCCPDTALATPATETPVGQPGATGGDTLKRRELLVDGDLHIDVLIDGAGPAIVMLPSSQRDSLDFDAVVERLVGAGFKVLRPQPRGMARSAGPLSALDLNVLAFDVKRVIDRFGDGRAIVAGHAFGHFVARVIDLNHAESVRGVAVLGGAARVFPPGLTQALDIAADPAQPRDDRLAALRHAFFAPGNDPSAWLAGWHPELRNAYRGVSATPPKQAWWPVSNAPVLDLQGAVDPWRPPSTRGELHAVLGDKVTVRVIAQASHALLPEQPAAVADAIVEWARSLPP
jgi:pimeloyl-ACP methyl ester carboxylesterase